MAAENVSDTNNTSGWSSTARAKATVATVLAASRLAENSTASLAATYKADTALDAVDLVSIIIAVVGVVVNVSAFTAVYRTHMRNRALRLGLLSLACSDLLLALSTVLTLWLDNNILFNKSQYPRTSRKCAIRVIDWIWDCSSYAQLFTIALLAVQQFVAFRWPLRTADGMSSRSSAYALAALWLVSVLLGLAPAIAIAVRTEHHPLTSNWTLKDTTRFCYQWWIYKISTSDLGQSQLSLSSSALGFAISCAVLPVMIGSYGYVAHAIKRTWPGDSCGGSAAEMAPAVRRHQDKKRVLIVTATVTLLCLASNLPQFIHNTLCQTVVTGCSSWMYETLMAIAALSTVADPLVYTLRLPAVRQVALSPLSRCHRCLTKSNKRRTVKHSCDDLRTQQTTDKPLQQ